MDKAEHGNRLRQAMTARGVGRVALADAMGVDVKTVTNWRGGRTLPSEADRVRLRQLLGAYDTAGDPVEVAIRSSSLVDWRQDAVMSFYKRNLAEQRAEAAS
jgi:transcriptional regulator with XRE-family HTH domain